MEAALPDPAELRFVSLSKRRPLSEELAETTLKRQRLGLGLKLGLGLGLRLSLRLKL